MSATLPFVQVLEHGIHVIDTGFHRPLFDASFLIVENGRAAFVDTGTNHSVPRLLAALEAAGLALEAVDFVIATHVHLDHAGGAGLLMQALPAATLVVHPRGAAHLIDPTQLMNGARAVYGDEEVARSYGDVVGVPPSRVQRTEDGMTIELAGRPLKFIDTPGHARHHHCIWDERSRGFFTGDTFGLSYREFDTAKGAWLMPTTTPVQFEPEPLRDSIRRMLAHAPQCMYLTHYGRVGGNVAEVERLAGMLMQQMDEMVATALATDQAARDPAERHAALVRAFGGIHRASLRAHGCTLGDERIDELLDMDLELNAQGMAIWLDRQKR
jgi:glyoxylase-like metal-dependent hydrolase (beta-lactamase superfamily II)